MSKHHVSKAKVISAASVSDLNDKIDIHIKDGYIPQGGVSSSKGEYYTSYSVLMVKYNG